MIVSDLEGLVWCVVLGAILEAQQRGTLTEGNYRQVDKIIDYLRSNGVTPAAQCEIDAGRPVRRL